MNKLHVKYSFKFFVAYETYLKLCSLVSIIHMNCTLTFLGIWEADLVLKVACSLQELHTISELPTGFISGVAAVPTVEVEIGVLHIWLYSKLYSELIYIPLKQGFIQIHEF